MDIEGDAASADAESMEQSVQQVILDLLEADQGQEAAVKDAVLEALSEVADSGDQDGESSSRDVFLSSISVAGFRGIGPRATLDLYPAPGLTVISGRNGSGKSSFAEALEVALTGSSYRWRKKETMWAESWRNLHQPDPCEIRVGLTGEGTGAFTIGVDWAADEPLTARRTWTQVGNGKRTNGIDALGWGRPLELFRPMLSYDELGRLFDDGPSALYDALAKVLGLEVLADAEKWLAGKLKTAKVVRQQADDARKRLRTALANSTDERAINAAALLKHKAVDLHAAVALATGADRDELTVVPQLRTLTQLEVPTIDTIEELGSRLRAASQAVTDSATGLVGLTQQRVDLLQAAVRYHDSAGEVDCPVCGQGRLDAGWAEDARQTIATTDAALSEYRAALESLKTARSAAVTLITTVRLVAPVDGVDLPALDSYNAAVAAAQQSPDDPAALAGHLESTMIELADWAESLRAQAAAALSTRESAWAPLASQLAAWISLESDARDRDGDIKTMEAAKKWMNDHAAVFRNLRLEPIAGQARQIWGHLRQESNVDLGDITLEGTATRRRAVLGGFVDGQPTKALPVMSQGELHALALALFIPRATAAASPFRFIVLDDPVQAMDPAKVDGLVTALTEIAKSRQVIVFSHDDRLASVIRETGIDARLIEVVREAGSRVRARDNVNPAIRQVEDVFAIIKDDRVSDEVKRRVAPGLFRLALEAAAKQALCTRRSLSGRPRDEWETEWGNAKKTASRLALAVYDNAGSDLTQWLDSRAWRRRPLKIANAGSHGSGPPVTVEDARDLEKTVEEVLVLR
jgi:hypothetical protein